MGRVGLDVLAGLANSIRVLTERCLGSRTSVASDSSLVVSIRAFLKFANQVYKSLVSSLTASQNRTSMRFHNLSNVANSGLLRLEGHWVELLETAKQMRSTNGWREQDGQ